MLRSQASELAQLMAHVSRWLDSQGLMPEELTEEVAGRFLADRRGKYRKFRTRRGLRPLLTYLRRIGVVPPAEPAVQDISADVALAGGGVPAVPDQRAWAGGGVDPPLPARCPLSSWPGCRARWRWGWARLSAAQVSRFVIDQAGLRSVPDAKSMVTALRSLLRFLYRDRAGSTADARRTAVPSVAGWQVWLLCHGRLRPAQTAGLLDSCDRRDQGRPA